MTVQRGEENFGPAPRGTNINIEVNEELLGKMSQLIQQSSSYDEIEVVERKLMSATDVKYVHYDTLSVALQQFIQTRPTDEYLLHEDEFILNRKVEIVKNLKEEVKKIDNLIPSTFVAIDYVTYQQRQGKKMIQHFKKIFPMNKKSEDKVVEMFLGPFLGIYKNQLEVYMKELLKDSQVRNRVANGVGVKRDELGSRPRSSRITNSATDEKMILEEKRRDLNQLELLVLKIVIAVERINYYTMGVINPRDQNLKLIPFFDSQKDPMYDFQSCLKICSLIKNLIERQEQIERQLSPYAQQVPLNYNRTTVTDPTKSYYFDRRNQQDLKEKHEFREKFDSEESRKRVLDIWHEFSEDKTEAPAMALKVNLHLKINSLQAKFNEMGYQMTFQLFNQPAKPHSRSVTMKEMKDTWLFTTIDFAQTLLKDDLIMIIKVFKVKDVVIKTSSQKINPKSQKPMQLNWLKAFSIINVSEVFFENRMKDGKSIDPSEIRFFQYDQKWTLDLDYETILNEMRYNEFKGVPDLALTAVIGLKIQFTLMSSITRNELALRLDQATIVREKYYWDALARRNPITTGEKDPYTIFVQEMQQLTLKELKKAHDKGDTINELKININALQIKDKSQANKIFRIQVYLVEKAPTSSNLKFVELLYQGGSQSRTTQETFQTQISTLNKKGFCYFRNECYLRVPITLKTRDLINYKLVFFVYNPIDTTKVHSQITELMVEQEPERYTFYPISFGKISLLDSQTGYVVGASSQEFALQLYKFTPKKYLAEQLDNNTDKVPDSVLVISLLLNSQQYSTNKQINMIIEPELNQQLPLNQICSIIENLSNNDLLIYFTRIIYSLLHAYNSTTSVQSQEVLRAIIMIFKRFQDPQLEPFKSLVSNYEERWRGDRDCDRKLLFKLQSMLEKIPEQIIELFDQQIDKNVEKEVQQVELKLEHMPAILALVCRLFSREFQTQYASIREKINTYFRSWMKTDLCIYRPDLTESSVNLLINQMCSKPAVIVQLLEKDILELQKNVQVNATIAEEVNDDEDIENDNPFGGDDEEDDFQFVSDRPSMQRRDTFHNQTNESKDTDVQMKTLVQMKDDLKTFQMQFCQSIKNVVYSTSKYLHQEEEMDKDDPKFQEKIIKIIELQKHMDPNKKNEMLDRLIMETNTKFGDQMKNFKEKARNRLTAYHDRRKNLRQIYWHNLQHTLKVMINFIDRQFVLGLFDDKLLLKRIEPVIDKVAETIIPKFEICTNSYSNFYKMQQMYIGTTGKTEQQRNDFKEKFETYVKKSTQSFKFLRVEEQKEIEKQVKAKVLVLSDLIASDTFILLPSDKLNQLNASQGESIQEILATKLSLSVYNHLKQYKNQFKETQTSRATMTRINDRIKDTTQSELQYLFVMKMAIFEKNFYESKSNQEKTFVERQSFASQIQQQERNSFRPNDGFDDTDILGGLATGQGSNQSQSPFIVATEETKDQRVPETQNRPEVNQNPMTQSTKRTVKQSSSQDQEPQMPQTKRLNESMKLGLGAKKEINNHKDRQEFLYEQFEPQTPERRLCFFLNEMEDAISKYLDLKDNAQHLSVPELATLKRQHISLFSVLSLQHLSSLTSDAFILLYRKRPGCLDRLVKQVRVTTTTLEFGLDEFFFHIKKLNVVEQFCKNVIEMLCEPRHKKYISELSDKYTYKSIVSQVWVLQLTLLAEQAQVLYDFVGKGSVLKGPDPQHEKNVADFQRKLQAHYATQQYLWSNYKEIEDLILPDESLIDLSGITGRIIKILQVDIEDTNLQQICEKKLQSVLRPLAMMFVQIDVLTFTTQSQLSHRVFAQIAQLLKEFVDYSGQQGEKSQLGQRLKKKQICDAFCEEYSYSSQQMQSKDNQFRSAIEQRVKEITSINRLYLLSIQYEKTKEQEGNLLAQLICYYELMQLLQEKNLSVSFQNNIKVKYKNMIEHINAALEAAYRADKQKQEDDDMHICQKQPSQYIDQMKEVRAFMHVEDYLTYKGAMDQGVLSQYGDQHNVSTLSVIIDAAVQQLVPSQGADRKNSNQFFSKALELLSEKRALQETNYEFKNVIQTLDNQIQHYKMYENFEEKQIYCNYYRVKIDSFLPEEMQVKDRYFVYRTPSGYNQEFIKHDIGCLLNDEKVSYSKDCEVKPLQPLTSEVRLKYNISSNIKKLSETPEEVNQMCPPKFYSYFKQNFKKQFYVEQCPSLDPAQFNEEFVITIYEVKKTFPTMTMIQQVYMTFEMKIPRVMIELYNIRVIITQIQKVLKKANTASTKSNIDNEFTSLDEPKGKGKNGEATTLDELIKKYITNDDVGGGFPKLLDLFFNEALANDFVELQNFELKRAYLDLFKGFENWLDELRKAVEVFNTYGNNADMHKQAEERLEDRTKVLNERRIKYKLHQLQENF